MRLKCFTTLLASLLWFLEVSAQQVIPLYKGEVPNSIVTADEEYSDSIPVFYKVTRPTITVYKPAPDIANGVAVLICPGGGYGGLWMKNEGWTIAEKLTKLGITAFVLKYRLPDGKTMKDPSIGPLQDAQRAMKMIREGAKEWKINPDKVGVMGFSAGGHLASTVGTHFNKAYTANGEHTNLRPDFMILVYPVISFSKTITHQGSKENLIGKNPSRENEILFSNELQVTKQSPPTFLIHAEDDGLVPAANSINFYTALIENSVPSGLHIFPSGGHGFPREPAHSNWFNYCALWLKENGWVGE